MLWQELESSRGVFVVNPGGSSWIYNCRPRNLPTWTMPLDGGSRLGHYDVLALEGVGGMGEVYRAFDSRLSRDVALKVLPERLANDAHALARLKREAHVLASLNHPNIAALYGVEEIGRRARLVLELVDGPTLADRLAPARCRSKRRSVARQIAALSKRRTIAASSTAT